MEKFKIGQVVKFKMVVNNGCAKGKGKIVKLAPKDAGPGMGRLTVKTEDGRQYRPWPSQVTVA